MCWGPDYISATPLSSAFNKDTNPHDLRQLCSTILVANSGLLVPQPSLSRVVSKPTVHESSSDSKTH